MLSLSVSSIFLFRHSCVRTVFVLPKISALLLVEISVSLFMKSMMLRFSFLETILISSIVIGRPL